MHITETGLILNGFTHTRSLACIQNARKKIHLNYTNSINTQFKKDNFQFHYEMFSLQLRKPHTHFSYVFIYFCFSSLSIVSFFGTFSRSLIFDLFDFLFHWTKKRGIPTLNCDSHQRKKMKIQLAAHIHRIYGFSLFYYSFILLVVVAVRPAFSVSLL